MQGCKYRMAGIIRGSLRGCLLRLHVNSPSSSMLCCPTFSSFLAFFKLFFLDYFTFIMFYELCLFSKCSLIFSSVGLICCVLHPIDAYLRA